LKSAKPKVGITNLKKQNINKSARSTIQVVKPSKNEVESNSHY
jgi:hypothetical protein